MALGLTDDKGPQLLSYYQKHIVLTSNVVKPFSFFAAWKNHKNINSVCFDFFHSKGWKLGGAWKVWS